MYYFNYYDYKIKAHFIVDIHLGMLKMIKLFYL